MAKLGSYYGLCPLTHHRSLLGISKGDRDGTIVATLGPNLAVKYKLSDQQPLQSWRSKEKFSSPIIYCKTEAKYVVAFNQSHIRLWNSDEEFVDKLKKIKFTKRIYTIFDCDDKSFIVFTNGCVKLVSEAVELRKECSIDDVLTDTETISEVLHASLNGEVFVGLLVSSGGGQYLSWTRFGSSIYHKIVLDRISVKLNGCAFHVNQGCVIFLSLWNDGKVYSTVLDDSKGSTQLGDLFTVIDSLSCKEHVPMISLDQDYLALYGASCDEEGSTMIVFNVQFKVTQCKLTFKFFTKDAKLWCVQDNLFVAVGPNLAVVPFYLDEEQLAALVGSHKITRENNDPDVSIVQKLQEVSWSGESKAQSAVPDRNFPQKIQEMTLQGLPESVIVEELLPELIENNDIDGISEMVEMFSKISEACLVDLLHLFLSLDGSKFQGVDCEHEDFPEGLQPLQKAALVDLLLQKSFNDVLLLPHLRNRLTTDDVLSLLQYFWFLLKEDGYDLGSLSACETETKIIEWSCAILDANYQKLLLSKDPKIVEALTVFSELIKEEADGFEDMVQAASLLAQMQKGSLFNNGSNMSDLKYRLEELDI